MLCRIQMAILVGAVVLGPGPSAAQAMHEEVRIEVVDSAVVLRLSPPMDAALRAFDPSFRPWRLDEYEQWVLSYRMTPRQAPSAVLGDFNVDGRIDLAVDGRTTTDQVLLVVLSKPSDYDIVELEHSPLPSGGRSPGNLRDPNGRREVYLTLVSPGTIDLNIWDPTDSIAQFVTDSLNPQLVLSTEAVAVHIEDRGGPLYFYRNGKFWRLFLGD